jgi:hypothetical protein
MSDFRLPEVAEVRSVRAERRADRLDLTVLQVLPGGYPAWPHARAQPLRPRDRDAACELLSRSIRGVDVVSEQADGAFACLLAGWPGSERLALLSWRLLDALRHLPQPERAPAQAGLAGASRPCIGICGGPAAGLTYQTLLARARTALRRARLQQSGFAFFDERLDGRR